MEPKKLFVGEPRICKQVAYVVDCAEYDLADKVNDVARCRDYEEVVVCAFKRKSKKLIRIKDKSITNVIYLDDVCKRIDNGYYDAVKKQSVALLEANKNETDENTISNLKNKNTESTDVREQAVKPQREPFFKRTWRRITHPIQTIKKIGPVLRYYVWNEIKWWFIRRYYDLKRFGSAVKWWFVRRYYDIKKIYCKIQWQIKQLTKKQLLMNKLKAMKLSELFLYVLYSKPNNKISCERLETSCFIYNKNIIGCSFSLFSFGDPSISNLQELYHNTRARIIKLSSLNGSYCLCDVNSGCYVKEENISFNEKQYQSSEYPKFIALGYDSTCNLCCKSCRSCYYLPDQYAQQRLEIIHKNLLDSGWLNKTDFIYMPCSGEIFYSPYYRRLIFSELKREQIQIFSNGILFNEHNWQRIKDRFKEIIVSISIDATTPETYAKLRGGNWSVLMQNLKMLGQLRREKKIVKLTLHFVVQRDNYLEMLDFIKLGEALNADLVEFKHFGYWEGSMPYAEYLQKSMVSKEGILDYELYKIFKNPLLHSPKVDIRTFANNLQLSDQKYRCHYARELK